MLHIANVRKILILILFLSVFLPLSLPILMSYPMCLEYNHDKNKQKGQQRLTFVALHDKSWKKQKGYTKGEISNGLGKCWALNRKRSLSSLARLGHKRRFPNSRQRNGSSATYWNRLRLSSTLARKLSSVSMRKPQSIVFPVPYTTTLVQCVTILGRLINWSKRMRKTESATSACWKATAKN